MSSEDGELDGLPSEEEMDVSAEDSSAEEEEEEEEEGSSEDDEEDEDSDEERPRKRRRAHQPFVPPPPRAMPARTTRGNRMGKVVADEGDEEFWNQDALKEEENDEEYETESEPEDVADRDFDEPETEEDSEDEEAERDAVAKDKKKKALKPPGYKKPPLPPKKAPGSAAPAPKKKAALRPLEPAPRRTVRDSTRMKVEEGEQERKWQEMVKPKRAARTVKPKAQLTQAELLAEAANTEIINTRSLALLEYLEEETKKKAHADKKGYVGPMIRFRSSRAGGLELTTLEVRNMHTPPELQPRSAAPPPAPALCAITGAPARYRDPGTGLPYATLDAFRELQRRNAAGLVPGRPAAAAAAAAAAAVARAATAQPVQPAAAAAMVAPAAAMAAVQQRQQLQQQQLGEAAPAPAAGIAVGRPQRQAAAAAQSVWQQQALAQQQQMDF